VKLRRFIMIGVKPGRTFAAQYCLDELFDISTHRFSP
jgi:hypothetical protein